MVDEAPPSSLGLLLLLFPSSASFISYFNVSTRSPTYCLMSSQSNPLRCNRCWKALVDEFAWVTSCSHIFCDDDANKYFSRQSTCPCCNSCVNRETDLKRVRPDLEEAPAMILWGQSPSLIFEACASALGFFMYQKKQELAWMNHIVSQKDKMQQSIQTEAQRQIEERDLHIKHLNEKVSHALEEIERKNAALTDLKQAHKETTRICKNYEKLYNQMKTVANRNNLRESPSPLSRTVACIGPPPTNQNFVDAPSFISHDHITSNNQSSKTIPEILTSTLPTEQQPIFGQAKKSASNYLGMPPRQGSVEGFTPKPLKTIKALRKGMQRSSKDVIHPLNKHSPHTMMRLTTTPRAMTTPMSIFQSMRPSLYSRFSIQRRK